MAIDEQTLRHVHQLCFLCIAVLRVGESPISIDVYVIGVQRCRLQCSLSLINNFCDDRIPSQMADD